MGTKLGNPTLCRSNEFIQKAIDRLVWGKSTEEDEIAKEHFEFEIELLDRAKKKNNRQ